MKLKKVIALTIGTLLLLGMIPMSAIAAAKEIDLGDFNFNDSRARRGWLVDGTEGKTTNFTKEIWKAATELRVELEFPLEGDLLIQYYGNDGNWTVGSQKYIQGGGDVVEGTTIVVDLRSLDIWDDVISYDGGVLILYSSGNLEDIGITSATLVYEAADAPAAPPSTPSTPSNPKTSDNVIWAASILALLMAVCVIGILATSKKTGKKTI